MSRRVFRLPGRQPAGFLAGGLALTLLIWVLGTAFAWHSRTTEVARAEAMARGVAETLAFNAAATAQNINGALAGIAEEFAANWSRFDFERFRATGTLRTAIAGVPAVTSASVVDSTGHVLHRDGSPESARRSVADWSTFLWHRDHADDSLRLSPRQEGGPDGLETELIASRRLTAPDGSFLGVALLQLDHLTMVRELHAGRLWDGAIVGLYDAAGTLLVRTAADSRLPPLPNGLAAALRATAAPKPSGDAGTEADVRRTTAIAQRTGDRIVAFARAADLPLAVGLAVPLDEALERWREDTLRYALLLVVLTLVMAMTAMALRAAMLDLSAHQRKVAENERRFRSIFNNAGAGIALVDKDGCVAEINEQFARILQRDRPAVIGSRLLDLTHPEDRGTSEAFATRVRAGEAPAAQYEKRYVLPDGSTVWVEVTLSPQIDVASRDLAPGEPRGSVVVARDITSRRAAREVIQDKTRALERSNVELEEFAYVASHDLQEPLRTVASYLQLLQRRYGEDLDGDAREYIGFAVAGAHRMSLLIQDLLQYSRVGRKGKPLVPLRLDIAMKAAVQGLSSAISENGAMVLLPPHGPMVLGDEAEITRLFQNLIGNAIKYRASDRPPVVRVTLEDAGTEWVAAVADNGIGIESRYFEKVFKIFQRLHGRDEYEGTGVGLSICKKIAERHGGRIWVESQPGRGSTFFVALPALAAAVQAAAAASATPSAAEPADA